MGTDSGRASNDRTGREGGAGSALVSSADNEVSAIDGYELLFGALCTITLACTLEEDSRSAKIIGDNSTDAVEEIGGEFARMGYRVEVLDENSLEVEGSLDPDRYPIMRESLVLSEDLERLTFETRLDLRTDVLGRLSGWEQTIHLKAFSAAPTEFRDLVKLRISIFDIDGAKDRLFRFYYQYMIRALGRAGYFGTVDEVGRPGVGASAPSPEGML